MLKCSTSLWSADLANLASEIRRVEPFTERFHLDVADGHQVDTMLFFPDLVRALRKHTGRRFEIHLATTHPLRWIEPFTEAGADLFIIYLDSANDPREVLAAIRGVGRQAGISLTLPEPVDLLEPFWEQLDLVTIVGTAIGVKGAGMDPAVPGKIRQARDIINRRHLRAEIQADGGIRRETVPLILAAGADFIVPGSLMFGDDPGEMRRWLASL